ncbi:uncharacterized protein LAESUDRAFT_758326 [Laetiporus sulphureus 93-53]|uniref:Uncharacterized protein n=1 Tax=Laetiporus sulphureus 93-53 TaxID=1314785 RepID=A0A165EU22_9APHY|nr:uncharacterized protein LAESUDRAFT_758326 [Laetiporus sulphureus 93-53]KZT07762.1 hypothetical protein LAESUDRAFT_758326 [Laetiporus sulphureus 93-53]
MFTVPKFSNPTLNGDALEITTRAALKDDDVVIRSGETDENRSKLLSELEQLVKRSLGDVYLSMDASMADEEEHLRKKKKRKTKRNDEAGTDLVESMPFRLVSERLPPKPVSLSAQPIPALNVKEPECEDDDVEAERRRSQAQAVAVDFGWIEQEGEKIFHSHPQSDKKILHVQAKLPSPHPQMFLAEIPKDPPEPPKITSLKPGSEVLPSPHNPSYNDISCTVVSVIPTASVYALKDTHQKRRRRKHSRASEPRPPAMFWRPLLEWGAKAAGYAMGYGGSWPVYKDDPLRYQYHRDTMRKGVVAT